MLKGLFYFEYVAAQTMPQRKSFRKTLLRKHQLKKTSKNIECNIKRDERDAGPARLCQK